MPNLAEISSHPETVSPIAEDADAGAADAGEIMVSQMPNTLSAQYARPALMLVRDEQPEAIANARAVMEKHFGGEMQEYPDATGRGPTLFRYTGFDGVQSAHSIPLGRLTPHVRAILWELAEAIEDEGRRQGG